MANRDHTLDSKITDAAYSEFLEKGYPTTSLRKIAEKAGVTVGAIQIRYKTKDELFCSLLKPFLSEIEQTFQDTKVEYWHYPPGKRLACLETSMRMESEAILNLIFDHYNDAVLLLCRSDGSSLAGCFDHRRAEGKRNRGVFSGAECGFFRPESAAAADRFAVSQLQTDREKRL